MRKHNGMRPQDIVVLLIIKSMLSKLTLEILKIIKLKIPETIPEKFEFFYTNKILNLYCWSLIRLIKCLHCLQVSGIVKAVIQIYPPRYFCKHTPPHNPLKFERYSWITRIHGSRTSVFGSPNEFPLPASNTHWNISLNCGYFSICSLIHPSQTNCVPFASLAHLVTRLFAGWKFLIVL